LWLLRDVPALLGILASFWSLVICAMINDRKAMRADLTGKIIRDQIAALLAHAEAHLDYALWRQAYRRLGWHPREAKFHLIAPTTRWADTQLRLQNYCRAFGNMQGVVNSYVEHLRQQHRISEREAAAVRSSPLRLAARATAAGFAGGGHSLASRPESSRADRRGRWLAQRDGGGCALLGTRARGPPLDSTQNQPTPSRRLHLRDRLRAPDPPNPHNKNPGRRGALRGLCCLRYPSDQLKPIQRPPAAVATQLRIDITAIILAIRPPAVASSL
jgi:hypothetical protein